MAEMKDHLMKVSRLMSSEMSALMPASLSALATASSRSGAISCSGACSENKAEYFAHLRDFACAGHETDNVYATVEYRYTWNKSADAGTGSVNIQDGDYQGVLMRGAFQNILNGVDGISFYTNENDICLFVIFFGCAGFYGKIMFAF